ncbi:Hypp3154 [Branchiostoma lanceolatum]|uniref:Hypp3154 protein n=1 Tax=Branchiostoma lanceolatum TaxID=7740 RepID=A0A8K0EQV6_BRALA|nr:Hypp3154 [Branchiostoma lanceolatum]
MFSDRPKARDDTEHPKELRIVSSWSPVYSNLGYGLGLDECVTTSEKLTRHHDRRFGPIALSKCDYGLMANVDCSS